MTAVQKNKIPEPSFIRWGGDDPFTHTLVVGPTRCGKTAIILKPLIYQILDAKRRGIPVGLSVIEPKGDVARMVKEMAEEMGLKDELKYIDPMYPNETHRINVMKGDKANVAEATVAVLKSLFGKQDAFFATVQELSSRKVTLLLKELYGDNMDIMDVLANLRDVTLLQTNVEKLRAARGANDLVQFFDNELLGKGNMAEKYRQFIVGLRAQLENITSNEHLRAIVTGKSDIDLDEHFERGNILAVNTALGLLGRSGDAFGMFIAMHLQLATYRRKGTERTRIPHYLIIDELSRYINPDLERFLSISAEYRVGLIGAIQSLGQLELESGNLSGKAMKRAILTSTRNKIIFGGLEYEDAEEVSKIMGKDLVRSREKTFSGGILDNILPKHYKDTEEEKQRFYSTFLMDGLPRFHYVHKLLINGTPQIPGVAVGEFVPRDWKEKIEKEKQEVKQQKIPPIWDWKGRAEFAVKQKRLEETEARKARAEVIFSINPFENTQSSPSPEVRTLGSPLTQIETKKIVEPKEKAPVVKQEKMEKADTEVENTSMSSIVFDISKMKKVPMKNTSINKQSENIQEIPPKELNQSSNQQESSYPKEQEPVVDTSDSVDSFW
ncbi:type IV secretory system conjugative DNA transfer family protein [Robertmurraya yapensis (ex Hitch et al 2024)]|uniref:type IV secretory system conjugative DNA transfer family protein n=1 Tax=Robertmurraya yapensis (ex Hitch et al 2024) TaxID=3133160 RepID=UPI003369C188